LSQDWEVSPIYQRSEAYCNIQASIPDGVIGWLVVKDGVVVGEGYDEGHDGTELHLVYSTTKSWSGMLVGNLVKQGLITVNDTLGDIFSNETVWDQVSNATYKQSLNLHEILSMTTGLKHNDSWTEAGQFPQETLVEVLNSAYPVQGARGTFIYLAYFEIIARIIVQITGLTPREYAVQSGIFEALGITDDDYEWRTYGGIESSATGFYTNNRVQAKLAQLYLQQGFASEDLQLVDPDWVDASSSNQLPDAATVNDAKFQNPVFYGYGYYWYAVSRRRNENSFVFPEFDGLYCAIGKAGQYILVAPKLNLAISIISDAEDPYIPAFFALLVYRNFDKFEKEVDACRSRSFALELVRTTQWAGAIILVLRLAARLYVESRL